MPDDPNDILSGGLVFRGRRSANYDPIIEKHAQRTGIDPNLIRAVMGQESSGNPIARSPKGASGLMQLMPGTARRFGVSNITDPEQNIRGGTDYLKFLTDRYQGDSDKVIAAYNAGERNVDKYRGIPPFRETQNYVPAVKARYQKLTGQNLQSAATSQDSILSGGLVAKATQSEPDILSGGLVETPQTPSEPISQPQGRGAAMTRVQGQKPVAPRGRGPLAGLSSGMEGQKGTATVEGEAAQSEGSKATGFIRGMAEMAGLPTQLLPSDAGDYINEAVAKGSAGLMRSASGAIKVAPRFATLGVPNPLVEKMIAPVTQPIRQGLNEGSDLLVRSGQAIDQEANRGVVSQEAQNLVAGSISSAPAMILTSLGIPAPVAFGAQSYLESEGHDATFKDIVKETAKGATIGMLFELPLPAKQGLLNEIGRRVVKAGIVGGGTEAVNRAIGQSDPKGALVNALFAASGGAEKPETVAPTQTVPDALQAKLRGGEIDSTLAARESAVKPATQPSDVPAMRVADRTQGAQPIELPSTKYPESKYPENLGVVGPTKPVEGVEEGAKLNRWQHRNFGLVTETADQSGVTAGRVRVIDGDGNEHIIQRSNGRGEGNNVAVPVRAKALDARAQDEAAQAAENAPFKVIDRRGQNETQTQPTNQTTETASSTTPRMAEVPSESATQSAESVSGERAGLAGGTDRIADPSRVARGADVSESRQAGSPTEPVRHVDLQPRRQRGEGKGQFKEETKAQRESRLAQVNPEQSNEADPQVPYPNPTTSAQQEINRWTVGLAVDNPNYTLDKLRQHVSLLDPSGPSVPEFLDWAHKTLEQPDATAASRRVVSIPQTPAEAATPAISAPDINEHIRKVYDAPSRVARSGRVVAYDLSLPDRDLVRVSMIVDNQGAAKIAIGPPRGDFLVQEDAPNQRVPRTELGTSTVLALKKFIQQEHPEIKQIEFERGGSTGGEYARERSLKVTQSAEPSAATPGAPQMVQGEKSTTSARTAQMSEDRAALDLPELPPAERKSWRTSLDNAKPERALLLADEVLTKPRALNDEETASLVVRAQQIKNEHSSVMREIGAATDPEEISAKRSQAEALQREFDAITTATKASGTEKGRALASQKLTINQDFDLVSVKQRMKAAKGRELTSEETTRYENMVKERDQAILDRDAALERAHTAEIQKQINKTTRQRTRSETKEALDSEAATIKTNIAAEFMRLKALVGKQTTLSQQGLGLLDPDGVITKNILKYARNRVKASVGLKAEALIDEVHDLVKDFGATRRQVAEVLSGYMKPRETKEVDRATKELADIRKEIGDLLAKEDVATGVRTEKQQGPKPDYVRRNRELKSVRERIDELKSMIDSGIRTVRGKTDKVPDVEMESLRAERDALSNAVKALTDPNADQKAIDSALNAVTKSVENLEGKLRPGKIAPEPRTVSAWSKELGQQQQRRVELQKQLNDARKAARPDNRAQNRIDQSLKATNQSIEDLQKRIAAGQTKPALREGAQAAYSPEISAAKKVQAALQKTLSELRAAERRDAPALPPKQGPPRRLFSRNATRLKQLQAKEADLTTRMASGNYSPRARPEPLPYNREVNAAQVRVKQIEREFNEEAAKRAPKTVGDYLVQWKRFAILGFPSTIGKLGSAATGRMAATPLYELMGEGLRRVPSLRSTFKDVPRSTLAGERAAISQLWQSESFKDVLRHLKGGDDMISLLYGEGRGDEFVQRSSSGKSFIPKSYDDLMDRPGHIHAAIKVIPKRAAIFRTFENLLRTEQNKPNGRDVSDPAVQLALMGEAYPEAQRAVLQQRNPVSSLFNRVIHAAATSDSRMARGLGKALQFQYPITKVPVNFVGESLLHMGGLPAAGLEVAGRAASGKVKQLLSERGETMQKIADRLPDAVSDLKPEERQRIARALKTGSVGLGFVIWGMMRPDQFGGYYQPGKRDPKDVKAAGMRFMGINIPRWMGHIPPLEAAQFGATLRRVHDSLADKGKSEAEAAKEAGIAGLRGLGEEVPFIDPLLNSAHGVGAVLGKEGERTKFLGGEAVAMVPGALRQGAKTLDYPSDGTFAGALNPFGSQEPVKREEKTVGQIVKGGIPVLRQTVPEKNSSGKLLESKGGDDPLAKEFMRLDKQVNGASKEEEESQSQYEKRRDYVNKEIESDLRSLIDSREYKRLSESDKKQQISMHLTNVTKQSNQNYRLQNNMSKPPALRQIYIESPRTVAP